MATQKEMAVFLGLQPDNVASGLTVVETKDLLGPLLHVSTNPKIKEFVPSVTRRTGADENRSVPRVSTAPSLIGCLIGYIASWSDFAHPEEGKKGKLLQELTIYQFNTPLCLRPNTKLLYDQKESDEHWLVGYSRDTMGYTPTKVGRFFYKDVLLVGRPGKQPFKIFTMLLEVTSDTLVFSKNIKLTKGFWEIRGPEPAFKGVRNWTDDRLYTVKQITKAEFDYVPHKEYMTYEDFDKPVFMSW